MSDSLTEVLKAIHDAAEDLAHLDVITLTGDITISDKDTATPSPDQHGPKKYMNQYLKLGEIYDRLISKTADANIKVLAFTRKEPDMDTITFVSSTVGEGQQTLISNHKEMVTAAEEGRTAFVKMIKDVIGLS